MQPPLYKLLNYNHSAIQQQAAQLALNLDLIHNPIVSTSNPISLDTLYNEIPTIRPFLNLFNFTVANSALMVLKELSTTGIYSDVEGFGARIEIPVIGCDYAHTAYYTNARLKRFDRTTTVNYCLFHSEEAVEIDRLVLRQPAVINTKVPRCTTVTRPHVRRISLMLDVGVIATRMLTNLNQ